MKCESISERAIAKATVLIAEEKQPQARILKDFLELNGYAVVLLTNGTSVFSAVARHEPDVILLGRQHVDANSAKICRRLKQNPETSGVPIIMLTDTESTSDRIAGLAAGADDCIALPYNDEELSALICARVRAKSEWDDLKLKARHLEQMLTQVESLASLDPLTGLYNRRRFESDLASELRRSNRYELPLSCLILDIDHFKLVNDTFGHNAGDEVLRVTAAIIQKNIREVDLAARWGGEEFIILSPSTEKKNARIIGKKILAAVFAHTYAGIGGMKITVSIGVAGIPHEDIVSADQLVNAADLAMYEAKKQGRNRVVVAE